MYLKRKRFLSFQYKKIHLDLLKTPSPSPIFSARNTISARSTPMHLVYKKNILFASIQLIIKSQTNVDHLIGGLL